MAKCFMISLHRLYKNIVFGRVELLDKKDVKKIQEELKNYDLTREKMLQTSRSVIRSSGWAIVQIHRHDLRGAKTTLRKTKTSLMSLKKLLKPYPELKSASSVVTASQEFTEAKLLQGIVSKKKFLAYKEIGVAVQPYLLGILDFIGELRRMTIEYLRKGCVFEAERTLSLMEYLYEDLYSLDHTAIIPTFRHKIDTARRLIESTRGDVVTEIRRLSLENALKDLKQVITDKTT